MEKQKRVHSDMIYLQNDLMIKKNGPSLTTVSKTSQQF